LHRQTEDDSGERIEWVKRSVAAMTADSSS